MMVHLDLKKDTLCWTRKRAGRGFSYLDEHGDRVRDKQQLRRIKSMAIPPMWKEVFICSTGQSKVQAVGRDLKGRKQYIYHSEYTALRQQEKFRRLRKFGEQLPAIRSYAMEQMKLKGWPREKILSLMVLILDDTGIRIGNRQYLEANKTYGLSTLRRRHLDQEDDALVFEYQGKSGKSREVRIEDETLMSFIRKTAEQPGYEIFRYQTADGWEGVDSEEINDFIHRNLGGEYSSKYFRTWVANRLLLEHHAEAVVQKQLHPRKSKEKLLVRQVANGLGNTPAVCKNYYLHPGVLKRAVRAEDLRLSNVHHGLLAEHSESEQLLLRMMKG